MINSVSKHQISLVFDNKSRTFFSVLNYHNIQLVMRLRFKSITYEIPECEFASHTRFSHSSYVSNKGFNYFFC